MTRFNRAARIAPATLLGMFTIRPAAPPRCGCCRGRRDVVLPGGVIVCRTCDGVPSRPPTTDT